MSHILPPPTGFYGHIVLPPVATHSLHSNHSFNTATRHMHPGSLLKDGGVRSLKLDMHGLHKTGN